MSPDMLPGIGIFRGVIAAVLMMAFIALWAWAYSGRRRAMFERVSQLPLEDDSYRADSAGGALK
jgi:cytochrome c oxidase cbb3-type subunit IV